MTRLAPVCTFLTVALLAASCGDDGTALDEAGPVTVTLVAHDSFAVEPSLLEDFAAQTGIEVEVVTAGDAGQMISQAILTAGDPLGDVMFGVDNTLLQRSLDAGLFEPYEADGLVDVPARFVIDDQHRVTPIDFGDVCVNYWTDALPGPVPTTLADLTDPIYAGELVVQSPESSSPGLAFLLATIARYGDAWPNYWERLRANDVAVVNGWSEAYLSEFTAGGGDGDRPLVVSYSTSPPAEIVYAEDPKPERPSTSVMLDGCYRQVEFAGVLRGAADVASARAVVDWLVSPEVQADVPLSMFVFPSRDAVALPEVFERFVTRPAEPLELGAEEIAAQRDEWIEQWTQLVLR